MNAELVTSAAHNGPIGLLAGSPDPCEDVPMTNTPYPTPPRPAGWFGGFDSRDVVTSPIRNITVGPNDGTFIPGHGYANGRTVSYMVATAIIVAMGWTR